MSKNRYGKMQGNMQYNRPSGGYQKNVYRQQINAEGIKAPKVLDQKKFRIVAIAIGVVWILISILLILKLKWWGLLVAMIIGAAVVGGGYWYIRHKEKEMITYYKKIGMTEEMYIRELKKRNVDKKQIEQVRKDWSKISAEPVVGANAKSSNTKSGSKNSKKK